MKNLLIGSILFFVLFPGIVQADEFIVKEFKNEPQNLKARKNLRLDANDEPCALILIQTTVSDLGITANTFVVGDVDYKQGEYWLYVSEGTRRLSFFAPDIQKLDYPLPERIKGSEVYVLKLYIKSDPTTKSLKNLGFLFVQSSPSQANIYIDGKPTGIQSPMQTSLLEGTHAISITKPGYKQLDTVMKIISGETSYLQYELKKETRASQIQPQSASSCDLHLEVTPSEGIEVFINGESISYPLGGNRKLLKEGVNQVSVFKPYHRPIDTTIHINSQPVFNLQLYLQPTFSGYQIITHPPADIIIDKKRVGNGQLEAKLFEGYHLIEIARENYHTYKQMVYVTKSRTDTISVYLLKKQASLQVITHPSGAEVYINDTLVGVSPLLVDSLAIEKHLIMLTRKGFATYFQELDITTDMTYELNEELLMGKRVWVKSFPDSATISYGNINIGTTPFEYSFPMSEVILACQRTGYELHIDTISIPEVIDSIHFDLSRGDQGPDMIFVKGGCFKRKQGYTNFEACVEDFYISKYEVTNKEFCSFLNFQKVGKSGVKDNRLLIGLRNHKIRFSNEQNKFIVTSGYEDHPVNYVTWYGGQGFCTWQNGRLPTEAEWLYAAQERGKNNSKYSGGDDLTVVAWYKRNSNGTSQPVGKKQANSLGIFDLSGNLMEWCYDWYAEDYFVNSPVSNPMGPKEGWGRVLKGGSFDNMKGDCNVAKRFNNSPETSRFFIGFRLARSAQIK